MKHNRFYPIVFTVALCGACSAVLTFASAHWEGLIAANQRFVRVRAILDAVGLLADGMGRDEVLGVYDAAVRPARKGTMDYYEARLDGEPIACAMEFAGRGRCGPIKGVVAFDPTARRLLNLRIYEQSETPGLGGRIGSRQWLAQFSGKPIGREGLLFSEIATGPNVIRPVTGASKTMFSLSRMLNEAIARFLAGGVELVELALGLTPDSVSKATPGLPNNHPAPPHLRAEVRRPPFLVPKGGNVNLALHKPVTASEEPVMGLEDLEKVTDGVKKSEDYHCVDLGPYRQWVRIDLETEHTIYAVVLWHFYKNPIIYNDVIVQVSNDPEFRQGVLTLFNNDHDNSSGLGRGADTAYIARWWGEIADARGEGCRGTRCRYVRVWTNGGTAGEHTRFVEIAVYGRPNL